VPRERGNRNEFTWFHFWDSHQFLEDIRVSDCVGSFYEGTKEVIRSAPVYPWKPKFIFLYSAIQMS
jgi:hypothetical protein